MAKVTSPVLVVEWKDLLAQWKREPGLFYFVAVRWEDASHDPEGDDTTTIEVITAGILKDINRKTISISHDVMENLQHRETSTMMRKNVRHLVLFGVINGFKQVEE